MEELDWPAQSPDLNPIEQLWDELERQLRARPNRPTSVPDLTNACVAEWKKVPAAMFQHLVDSLPRRVEAVIAAKGGVNSGAEEGFSLGAGLDTVPGLGTGAEEGSCH